MGSSMLTAGCVSHGPPSCTYLSRIKLHAGAERLIVKVHKSDTTIQQVNFNACREDSLMRFSTAYRHFLSAAALHPFKSPDLPADLGLGYPQAYTRKCEEASVGVEPVAKAVAMVRTNIMYSRHCTYVCLCLCCTMCGMSAGRPAGSV